MTTAAADRIDALVVGAGPAGSTAARTLASAGHRVVMVEEHGTVGHPVQCAGLVSRRVLELAGLPPIVRREVRGATVFGPSLRSVDFRAPEPRAYVIDRAGLDVHLAERAARAGVEVRTGTRFDARVGATDGGVRVRLRGPDGGTEELDCRLVVGADGVTSAVARAFRLRRPVEILPAFEAEFPSSPGDPETVEVYLGRAIAPGLFGWWIPDGQGGARVGVAADADGTSARRYYERLLEALARRFGRPLRNPTALLAAGIPIGRLPKVVGPRVVLVGDAAAQVKPLSGGGIFTGMRAGELAGVTAAAALAADDLSERRLDGYARAFEEELGDEFRRALYLRRVFVRLSDRELDALVDVLRSGGLGGTIVAFGDIDFPSHVARQLLRESPGLLRLLPKALGAFVAPGASGFAAPALEPGPLRK
ncbi:MAG TPA: NAD(P)/FAD-dependent oxidoreductase [Thermoplasmata archaeon]|nr:NAD(P)/FAD-dependent oxidoreductase [Thermoplasmata archaeon]